MYVLFEYLSSCLVVTIYIQWVLKFFPLLFILLQKILISEKNNVRCVCIFSVGKVIFKAVEI